MNGTNEWLNLLSNVGFPIVMAGYLMLQFEKRIQSLEETIRQLHEQLDDQEEMVKRIDQYMGFLERRH
ncbi:YvrJ family protein [Fictibacillus iocasae]|uniref:YvrJ family protein n=1 Tax=Fictibacillus iocasae TaxID=2715437 RepID=A0ABW2NUD2_9BACL